VSTQRLEDESTLDAIIMRTCTLGKATQFSDLQSATVTP